MTRSLLGLFAFCALALGFIACGDDGTTSTPTQNVYLKFAAGDTFTYDYYDRNPQNARVDTSKKVIVWAVLRTDAAIGGRTGAAEIREKRYESDGTTLIDSSTLYLWSSAQGEIYQHNVLQTVISRFGGSIDLSPVISQIGDNWIKIGDVKTTGTLTWNLPGTIRKRVENVPVTPTLSLDFDLTMDVNSTHKGRPGTTVPAGTYANAFSTDHYVPVTIAVAEDVDIPGLLQLDSGTVVVNDSVLMHYDIENKGGILRQSLNSKSLLIANALPFDIAGFEMELKSVVRAETED